MTTDDPHARIRAEVTRRLAIAREAAEYCPTPWYLGTDQVIDDDSDTVVVAFREVAAHIVLHDPADAIRRYERDLRVLQRHTPVGRTRGWCYYCYDAETGDAPWPCPEITDMATAYGLATGERHG